MKTMTYLAFAALAALTLQTLPAQAAKPAPQPACLQQSVTYAVDDLRGVVIVKVLLQNTCFPAKDMSGQAKLLLDGAVVDLQPLGADDKAYLVGEIRRDGGGHQLCVHFDGQQAVATRKGTVTSAVVYDQCLSFVAK